jgi:hypothetical protein
MNNSQSPNKKLPGLWTGEWTVLYSVWKNTTLRLADAKTLTEEGKN